MIELLFKGYNIFAVVNSNVLTCDDEKELYSYKPKIEIMFFDTVLGVRFFFDSIDILRKFSYFRFYFSFNIFYSFLRIIN